MSSPSHRPGLSAPTHPNKHHPSSSSSPLQHPEATSSSLPGSRRASLHLQRDPLLRTRTQIQNAQSSFSSAASSQLNLHHNHNQQQFSAASQQDPRRAQQKPKGKRYRSENDRTDARWAEMQATLAEVEISAAARNNGSGGGEGREGGATAAAANNHFSSFFGASHAAALEDLRAAQVALARAWARSEADNEVVVSSLPLAGEKGIGSGENGGGGGGAGGAGRRSEASSISQKSPTNVSVDDGIGGGAAAGGIGVGGSAGGGEREDGATEEGEAGEERRRREANAERDLEQARRRKEANDRYFERVGRGVVDVVGRLEEVAAAVGRVERVSREVWSESESLDSASVTDASGR